MAPLKILTVIGTRPQIIKAAALSHALSRAPQQFDEVVVYTGQHYDHALSKNLFNQLQYPEPPHNLEVGSGSINYQVGEGLKRLEPVVLQEKPDMVLVYGDTNATLVGALTGRALNIPVAHVEAGIRSYNRRMPEENNRILTDHLSHWCFAPTPRAMECLRHEGIVEGVHWVGDIMLDAVHLFRDNALNSNEAHPAETAGIHDAYWLMTLHRAESTANPQAVIDLLRALDQLGQPILFPVHPRTRSLVEEAQKQQPFHTLRCVEPLGYLQMLQCLATASGVITDSGGLQKEAAFFKIPCLTLRNETEWPETVETQWNHLVGLEISAVCEGLRIAKPPQSGALEEMFGSGQARFRILEHLQRWHEGTSGSSPSLHESRQNFEQHSGRAR